MERRASSPVAFSSDPHQSNPRPDEPKLLWYSSEFPHLDFISAIEEDAMQSRILGTAMPVLEFDLEPNDSVISEAGELSWMTRMK